jgi:hypothetical protein
MGSFGRREQDWWKGVGGFWWVPAKVPRGKRMLAGHLITNATLVDKYDQLIEDWIFPETAHQFFDPSVGLRGCWLQVPGMWQPHQVSCNQRCNYVTYLPATQVLT